MKNKLYSTDNVHLQEINKVNDVFKTDFQITGEAKSLGWIEF